jgi:hypothetical protein
MSSNVIPFQKTANQSRPGRADQMRYDVAHVERADNYLLMIVKQCTEMAKAFHVAILVDQVDDDIAAGDVIILKPENESVTHRVTRQKYTVLSSCEKMGGQLCKIGEEAKNAPPPSTMLQYDVTGVISFTDGDGYLTLRPFDQPDAKEVTVAVKAENIARFKLGSGDIILADIDYNNRASHPQTGVSFYTFRGDFTVTCRAPAAKGGALEPTSPSNHPRTP